MQGNGAPGTLSALAVQPAGTWADADALKPIAPTATRTATSQVRMNSPFDMRLSSMLLNGCSAPPCGQCVKSCAVTGIHCREIGAIRHRVRGRERRRHFLRDLPRCGPFSTPLQRDHKVDRAEGGDVVAERRVKHASFAE